MLTGGRISGAELRGIDRAGEADADRRRSSCFPSARETLTTLAAT